MRIESRCPGDDDREQATDTVPELLVRRGLHEAGYRFRVDHPLIIDQRRRGDIVLTRRRAAVFIDGCF